jgi:hypothetical protein
MLIEFNSIISSINNSVHSIPLFKKILSNVIYTSIILSIILIIIVMFIYPCKSNTSNWLLVRLFIYLSIMNTIILVSYQSTISNKYKEKYMNDTSSSFITNINNKSGGNIYQKDSIKVVPNFKKSDDYESDEEIDKKEMTASNILDYVEQKI